MSLLDDLVSHSASHSPLISLHFGSESSAELQLQRSVSATHIFRHMAAHRQIQSIDNLVNNTHPWKPTNQQESIKRQMIRLVHLFENKLRKQAYVFWVSFESVTQAPETGLGQQKLTQLQKGLQSLSAFWISHQLKHAVKYNIEGAFRLIINKCQKSMASHRISGILNALWTNQTHFFFKVLRSVHSLSLKCDVFASILRLLFKQTMLNCFESIRKYAEKCDKRSIKSNKSHQIHQSQQTSSQPQIKLISLIGGGIFTPDWFFQQKTMWEYEVLPQRVPGTFNDAYDSAEPQSNDNILIFIETLDNEYQSSLTMSPRRFSSVGSLRQVQKELENQLTIKKPAKANPKHALPQLSMSSKVYRQSLNDDCSNKSKSTKNSNWRKDRQTLSSIINNVKLSPLLPCKHCQINSYSFIHRQIDLLIEQKLQHINSTTILQTPRRKNKQRIISLKHQRNKQNIAITKHNLSVNPIVCQEKKNYHNKQIEKLERRETESVKCRRKVKLNCKQRQKQVLFNEYVNHSK